MESNGPRRPPEVIGDWFRQWQQPLKRFLALRRSGSSAEIEEIAQETFLRLLRYDRADLISNPQAYLFTVAANVAAEWATRARRRYPHRSEWLDELERSGSADGEMERAADETELLHAINALPPRHREIVRLHFGEGLNLEDTARRLGLTRRIVKRDLSRAYASLRIALAPSSSTGLPATSRNQR